MARFAISFWLWMPATLKALLMAFTAMTAAFVAGVPKDVQAIEHYTWSQWLMLLLSVATAGAVTIIAFLDQTIQTIRSKASDTMLFYRPDRDKPDTGGQ